MVKKAVIPVAGWGTRFLPATKAIPKEMLPIVDKPAIQYVVEEAVFAGVDDLLLITGKTKRALEDHFDSNFELEHALKDTPDLQLLVKSTSFRADIHYTRQGRPLGLGHAIGCSRRHVGHDPFFVLLGDDIIDRTHNVLRDMSEVYRKYQKSVILVKKVSPDEIHRYGCIAYEETDDPNVFRVTDLVEKPTKEKAPSLYAVLGRYLLLPTVFDAIDKQSPGKGGEIQLTDALNTMTKLPAKKGGGVMAYVFDGVRHDVGDKLSYLKAIVTFALARRDIGPDFKKFLNEINTS